MYHLRTFLCTQVRMGKWMSNKLRLNIERLAASLNRTSKRANPRMDLFVKNQRSRCRKILSTFITSTYHILNTSLPEIGNRVAFRRAILWETDVYVLIIFSDTKRHSLLYKLFIVIIDWRTNIITITNDKKCLERIS